MPKLLEDMSQESGAKLLRVANGFYKLGQGIVIVFSSLMIALISLATVAVFVGMAVALVLYVF
jgi:hypothetical protein